jgi:hypothetical protein
MKQEGLFSVLMRKACIGSPLPSFSPSSIHFIHEAWLAESRARRHSIRH